MPFGIPCYILVVGWVYMATPMVLNKLVIGRVIWANDGMNCLQKFANHRKLCSCLQVHVANTTHTFSGSISTPWCEIQYPRQLFCLCGTHILRGQHNLVAQSFFKTALCAQLLFWYISEWHQGTPNTLVCSCSTSFISCLNIYQLIYQLQGPFGAQMGTLETPHQAVKSHLPLIPLPNPDLVIGFLQVQLRKNLAF